MSSINDDLMSGGKLQAALFSTDASGNVTGLVGPSGEHYPLQSRPRTLAFFGDSITLSAGQTLLVGYRISSTINGFTSTNWAILWADPETPSGDGAWAYNATTKLATWTPAGSTAGAAVDVSRSGIYYLPGPSAGQGLTIVWDGENTAYASGTTQVTVPADGNQYQAVGCARGYAVAALAMLGPAWRLADADVYPYGVALGGVPGFGSQALVSCIWQTDQIASDVDIIEIGTNDIAASKTAAIITANLQTFVESRLALGSQDVLILTIPPRDANTAAMDKVRADVNRWIKHYADQTARVTCVDISAAVCDPDTNNWVSGYSADGIHPTPKGAFAMAAMIADHLQPAYQGCGIYWPDYGDLWDATTNPYGSLIPAAGYNSFAGTGGTAGAGASGTVPSNYTMARQSGSALTLVGSKVARTDGIAGNWYQIELAGATGNEYGRIYPQTNAQALATYGLAAGDELDLLLEVNIPASSGLLYLNALITWSGTTARSIECLSDAFHGPAAFPDALGKMWLRTPPMAKIPAGATHFNVTFRMGTSASGTATIQLGRWFLAKKRT